MTRKGFQEYQDPVDRENIHKFLFENYSHKLKDIDIKGITSEHETALVEAFYHEKEALKEENLFGWFIDASDPFNRAAFWQLISPMYKEMLQILEVKLGPEHIDVATTLNNLAEICDHMGDYEKALPFYQRIVKSSNYQKNRVFLLRCWVL